MADKSSGPAMAPSKTEEDRMRQGALLAVAIAALKPKQRAPPVTFQLFGRTIDIHNNRSYARMTATFPERSLLVLTKENPIRKAAVLLTQATLFERLILLVILFNCITLSMFSNREGFDDTALGKALATCELAWLAVFTVEAVAKIIAMGLVLEEGSYMRDVWNVLDFCVVTLGYLSLGNFGNYTAIRTVRVLRPLRTLTKVKEMRALVVNMLTALPMLLDVLGLCAFAFLLFGIVAVQLYAGNLRNRCASANVTELLASGQLVAGPGGQLTIPDELWAINPDIDYRPCTGRMAAELVIDAASRAIVRTSPAGTGHQCAIDTPGVFTDGDQYCVRAENPNGGFTSYDNILWAWLTIFQCITGEAWVYNMYDAMDGINGWVWIYFVFLILFGSLFLVNLTLGVLYLYFTQKNDGDDEGEGGNGAKGDGEPAEAAQLAGPASKAPAMGLIAAAAMSPGKVGALPPLVKAPPPPAAPAVLEEAKSTAVEGSAGSGSSTRSITAANSVLSGPLSMRPVRTSTSQQLEPGEEPKKPMAAPPAGPVQSLQRHASVLSSPAVQAKAAAAAAASAKARTAATVDPERMGGLRRRCYDVAHSRWFEWLTVGAIVLNTLAMALKWHNMPRGLEEAMENVNYTLTVYFAVEMVVKLVGMGLAVYVQDRMNVFDAVVVVVSVVEMVLALTPGLNGIGSSLSVLRTLRLLRVFKLARQWKELNRIIVIAFNSITSIGYLCCILFLFMFIFALLGMQLFGYKMTFCDHVNPDAQPICPPGLDRNPYELCPEHYDCYVPCQPAEAGTWIPVDGSPYNGQAYCEAFPRPGDGGGAPTTWLAQVGKTYVPRVNFDNAGNALRLMFQMLTNENWNDIMYDSQSAVGPFAALYFVVVIVIGNFVLLNLFLAILLDNFGKLDDMEEEERRQEAAKASKEGKEGKKEGNGADEVQKSKGSATGSPEGVAKSGDSSSGQPDSPPAAANGSAAEAEMAESLQGVSLWAFSSTNPVRHKLAELTCHPYFESFVIVLIILSSLTLAIDSYELDQTSKLATALNYLDWIFTVCFAVEAVMKIIVQGFILNGKHSYMRNGWNVLDFLVVIISILLLSLSGLSSKLEALRALRTLRALRPLRVAARAPSLRLVVNALFAAIPALGNVLLVCSLFYIVFAILAMNLFMGKLYYCEDTDSGDMLDAYYVLPPGQHITRQLCQVGSITVNATAYHTQLAEKYGQANALAGLPSYTLETRWVKPIANYDNILVSMWTLFQVASGEVWPDFAAQAMDGTAVDRQPERDANSVYFVFFVLHIVINSFFVLNLVVGVTIDKFNDMADAAQGRLSVFLTHQQEEWVAMQRMLAKVHLQLQTTPPKGQSWLRHFCYDLVTAPAFDIFIMACIVMSILFMAMVHVDMSPTWSWVIAGSNLAFTGVFLTEALLKIVGLGLTQYLRFNWNRFDLFVVHISIVGVLVDMLTTQDLTVLPILRVLRVARIFRLIPRAKSLRTLLQALIFSLPALLNVGGVLILFYFIYAIIGMNLFGAIKPGEMVTDKSNFRNIWWSMLNMFRITTGEDWPSLMHECMITENCIELLDGPRQHTGVYVDPGSPELAGLVEGVGYEDRCTPHPLFAVVYFCTFVVLCAFILINLVVAVILDNMAAAHAEETLAVSSSDMEQFAAAWAELDPYATGYIPTSTLTTLLMELPPPLGAAGEPNARVKVQEIIMSIDIPHRQGGVCHFREVLHALVGRVGGTQLPENHEASIYEQLLSLLPKGGYNQAYTAAHFHSALYVQAAVRGFLARAKLANSSQQAGADEAGTAVGESNVGGGGRSPPMGSPRTSGRFVGRLADALQHSQGGSPTAGGANLPGAASSQAAAPPTAGNDSA